MGILNVTTDSFSGDGQLGRSPIERAAQLDAAGADIVDIGAESTRPWATALDPDTEWQRLGPVLAAVTRQPLPPPAGQPPRRRAAISVDTRHAATAARALELGVDIINDVTGLQDDALLAVLARARCDVVVMHALSVPVDPELTLPVSCDVVHEMLRWKAALQARASSAGLDPARLVFDPGIGFGKTAAQSLNLVHRAGELSGSGGRWLYGHSRKSFLRLFTGAPAGARDDLTLAMSAQLAHAGVHMLRVHDVARHAALFDALCG